MLVLMMGACWSMPGQAQELFFNTSGQIADLQCPARRAPPRHATPTAPSNEVMEPPSQDELEDLPPPEADDAEKRLLQVLGAPKADHPLSIGFWGDSHLAAHFFGDELIRISGLPRETVLPSLIPATMGRAGVRLPIRKYCQSAGWNYKYAYLAKETRAPFSQTLAQTQSNTPGSFLWVDFRIGTQAAAMSQVDVLLSPSEVRTVVGISVDDAAEQLVELEQNGNGLLQIHADKPLSQLKIRLVEGELRLEGFAPRYLGTPALRMDTFAIPGAMARGWAMADSEYVKNRLNGFQYDLVVLEYGTNEGNGKPFSAANYEADLRATLGNMRQTFPDSQCILMGPTDRGVLVKRPRVKKKKGKTVRPPAQDLLRYARIHQTIGNIQQNVGREFKCSFWSWQEAMGGPGATYRWFYHNPKLMAGDLIHLTIPGYQLSARKFSDSTGFQSWGFGNLHP